MTWGQGKVLPPAVTDPVVVDGTKYRIRSIDADTGEVTARTSFGDNWVTVRLNELTWDKVAGLWRAPVPL